MNQKIIFPIIGLAAIVIAACSPATEPANNSIEQSVSTAAPKSEPAYTPIIVEQATTYTTQNNLSGNHQLDGSIDLANATQLDIPLMGKPSWLVSAPFKDNAIFVAVMDDGQVQAFNISGTGYESFDISPKQLPAGMPPALTVSEDNIKLTVPPEDASTLTNPVTVNSNLVYIASNGDLVMSNAKEKIRLAINALPDSRILVDENNHLLILTEPTTRYDHGIAGDEFEASAIAIVGMEPELHIIQIIPIEAPDVIEGISAIWADIDNDGRREIIVTLSNSKTGARIVAYREDGTLLAESEPIGLGYRWRHQLAVAQFGTNELPLLVDIRTPHLGGIVEFLEFNDGELKKVMELRGFSTHSIGSRNLDSAIAADFNNDGIAELLAPDQAHKNLGLVSWDGVIYTTPLDDVLTSNLSATVINGKIIVGAGTQNNLRIWIP